MKKGPEELESERKRKVQKLDQNTPLFGAISDEQRFLNAAEIGDIETFDKLLGRVDINCTGICDETALMLAIGNAPKESKSYIIRCLLNHGADISMINVFGETAHSIAHKCGDHETVNILDAENLSHLGLPKELWVEIASYLGPKDLDNFREACRAFNYFHEQNTDILWQPLLNRLHAIDNTIKVTPKIGKNIRETFIEGFLHVVEHQADEIRLVTIHHAQMLQELQIDFGDNHPITLDILERRSELLDNINCVIIKKFIDKNPGNILEIIGPYNLSRFPGKILLGINGDYFNQLEILNLTGNNLWSIPNNISLCQNLKEFHCCENLLSELPESICHISTLEFLCCHDNILTQLPNRLDELVNLKKIVCDSNQITHLPNNIGKLAQLRELEIGSNKIQALPESMINILNNLTNYDFSYNLFLRNQENTIEDDINNAYFISFIDAKKSSPNDSKASAELDNNGDIWLPLLLELEKIDPNIKLFGKNNESLRDQFIERFQFLANRQLKMIVMLSVTNNQIIEKYPVKKNTFTGELSFEHLTLEQLIENDKQLKIDLKKTEGFSFTNVTDLSRVLLFQHSQTGNNDVLDAQLDAMDIDEVPKLKQSRC